MPPRYAREWSEIMTVQQVADYLQLNKLTVYRYIRDGRILAARVGKAYRVRKADVDAFLQSQIVRTSATRAQRPAPEARRPAPPTGEPVAVFTRPEPLELRERGLSVNPMEWVIRGLH